MTFKIPGITWAVGHSLINLLLGLHAPGWLYVLGIPPRRNLPLWTPRARARGPRPGPKLARGVRAGSLRATEPRAREETRGRKRKKMPKCLKHTFIHTWYSSNIICFNISFHFFYSLWRKTKQTKNNTQDAAAIAVVVAVVVSAAAAAVAAAVVSCFCFFQYSRYTYLI